jgi:serine/threonine protein kinase
MTVYDSKVFRSLKDHPIAGIPRIYDIYEADDVLTVIEEYVPGNTLAEEMRQNGPMDDSEVASLMLLLCPIISALHRMDPPIIHRDIKPSNLILTPSGSLFLLDLNAAKQWNPYDDEDTVLLGTKGYAAPEQFGFGSSRPQTDIYAIGVLANSLLSGTDNPNTIQASQLQPIIRKCTELRPEDRFRSISDLESALHGIRSARNLFQKPPASTPSWLRFLPPGFRHGFSWRLFLAIPAYFLLIYMCATLTIKDTEGVVLSPGKLLYERCLIFFLLLSIILFTFNYLGVHQVFPIPQNTNPIIRVILITLVCFLVIILFLVTGVLLEGILFPAPG